MAKKPKPGSNQGHPDPDKHGKEEYKRHIDGSIRVSGQIEVHPPPNANKEETSEEKKARTYRFLNFLVSGLTLIAVVIYAGLTYWQANSAQTSANSAIQAVAQARDQFRQDGRPYLWLTNTGLGTPEYILTRPKEGKGQVAWSFHFSDYGKTPAYNVRLIEKSFRIGKDQPFKESYGFSAHPPGIGVPMPPGKDDFQTIVFEPGTSAAEYKRLLGIDSSLSIRVHVLYTDSYGGAYETGICLTRLASGAIQYCENSYIK